jgi:hypothetical protein
VSKKSKRVRNPRSFDSQSIAAPQKRLGICVATPTLDGRLHAGCVATVMQLQKLCIEEGISFTWKVLAGNSILPLARNELAKQFLDTKATHLFMIDSDIQVDPRHILYLLSHDRMVSALPCSKREVLWNRLGEFISAYPNTSLEMYPALIAEGNFSTEEDVFKVDEFGFAKVLKVGTGAMMVKREVFEKMIAESPDNYFNTTQGKLHQFFSYSQDNETKTQYGEDYTFCNTWRKLGGEIDLLVAAKTKHHGQLAIEFNWKGIAETITEFMAGKESKDAV